MNKKEQRAQCTQDQMEDFNELRQCADRIIKSQPMRDIVSPKVQGNTTQELNQASYCHTDLPKDYQQVQITTTNCAVHLELEKKIEMLQKQIEELKPKDISVKECATPTVMQYDRNVHVKSFIFRSLSELYVSLESVKDSRELSIAKEKLDEFQLFIEKAIK